MKKYYCIPITNSYVFHSGLSLKDHLMIVDYPLYIRDASFKEFFYGRIYCDIPTNQEFENMINKEKEYMSEAFKEKNLPESIIAVSEGNDLYEISSKEKLQSTSSLLDMTFGITEEKAKEYLMDNPDYGVKVRNFFEKYYNKRMNYKEDNQEEKKEENNKQKKLLFIKNKNKNK
ncbi:MAG: hypothetical protein IJG68_01300 [Bacilli bacterium]|nr:hypothetical protein [Bacilli bacterium]